MLGSNFVTCLLYFFYWKKVSVSSNTEVDEIVLDKSKFICKHEFSDIINYFQCCMFYIFDYINTVHRGFGTTWMSQYQCTTEKTFTCHLLGSVAQGKIMEALRPWFRVKIKVF